MIWRWRGRAGDPHRVNVFGYVYVYDIVLSGHNGKAVFSVILCTLCGLCEVLWSANGFSSNLFMLNSTKALEKEVSWEKDYLLNYLVICWDF